MTWKTYATREHPVGSGPGVPPRRHEGLDILRGLALLGILVINVRYFAGPLAARDDPTFPHGDLHAADLWSWVAGTLLFEDKMIALFSMLFGAGIALTAGRGLLRQGARLFWLLLIGLAHGFLLWFGDILTTYALCGAVLLFAQRLPNGLLLAAGVACVLAAPAAHTAPAIAGALWPAAEPAATTAEPDARREAFGRLFRAEREAHAGDYATLFRWRAELVYWFRIRGAFGFDFWRCLGFMAIGLALWRLGMLGGGWPAGSYATIALVGATFGLALTAVGMFPQLAAILGRDGDLPRAAVARAATMGSFVRLAATIPTALGIAGAVLACCRSARLRRLLAPLGAVGRLALTNYLGHTVVCVALFEGFGCGLFGALSVSAQLGVVAAVWLAQLVLSPAWLRYFRFGPAEWAWRSLTWWRLQPWRRVPAA